MDKHKYYPPKIIALPRSPRDEAALTLSRAGLGTLDDYDIPEQQGIHSIVLFPKAEPGAALKIPLGNQPREAVINEIAALRAVELLQIESLHVPRVLRMGQDPDYILMTRMGPSLTQIWETQGQPDEAEIAEVANVIADFAVELHRKSHGMVHRDLSYDNLTREPDGHFGCVDFGDYGPGALEDAFIQVAVRPVPVLPLIARRVTQLTGTPLDLERLRRTALDWITAWDKA